MESIEFLPLLLPGVVMFFVGLGIILNGIFFTMPRKELRDATSQALDQLELDRQLRNIAGLNPAPVNQSTTNELDSRERVAVRPSVTEHTTHHLKPDNLN